MHKIRASHKSATPRCATKCVHTEPADTLTDHLNTLLNTSGPNFILSLCPGEQYYLTRPLFFTAPNQEISTAGYPTDSSRATLVINGSVIDGYGHTTAVDGRCSNCDGVKLLNVQVNGTRLGGPPAHPGANIEMGGSNANQVIEYVHTYDPRGWSALHISEGDLSCTNTTVQNNHVGPAGSARHWADGISVSCRNSTIKNNQIQNPTDGGIVLFGSPGTHVENNTIWVETQTQLGGINMVDTGPYPNYHGVVVINNTIIGGQPQGSGTNYSAIIKVGIAIGDNTWNMDKHRPYVTGAVVKGNRLTGAFSYGMAMSSASNFTVEDNVLFGSTDFVGVPGPHCQANDSTPTPAPFVIDWTTVQDSTVQSNFKSVPHFDYLICIVPPPDGINGTSHSGHLNSRGLPVIDAITNRSHFPAGMAAEISTGAIAAVLLVVTVTWCVRKWAVSWLSANPKHSSGYVLRGE